MQSKLLQKRGATARVVSKPFDAEIVDLLFCPEEEDDAAIQVMLEHDPEADKGKLYEQVKAEQDRAIEEWGADALQVCR